ncbi:MAG: cobalt-precorrin-5B (C(1))-methyltransferase CbiD [Bacteroidaceae bacterium]|nr:cobalt-precorrin-5B (C(1))-methyltransferase CbiD [Bacteroidaceae bacterium]
MILIFGGTTEGRLAVEVCEQAGKPYYYSTKGDSQKVAMEWGIRLCGAMTASDIAAFCQANGIRCIVDAAHPFAEALHHAIAETKFPVVRIARKREEALGDVTYCKDYADAMAQLEATRPQCLLALTGVNSISKMRDYWRSHRTVFRILSRRESLDIAAAAGFPHEGLIFYKEEEGLPGMEEEMEVMRRVGCDAVITKQSGAQGGFGTKVAAARQLGLKVFVIEAPRLPDTWVTVTGRLGLRRAIEHLAPDFFPLRTGLTTGACAAAAVKAAIHSLMRGETLETAELLLPDGETVSVPVKVEAEGVATVVKDFSDDPDVTRGCRITACLRKSRPTLAQARTKTTASKGDYLRKYCGVSFLPGKGVGRVTLPGLGIPVGEPAINPTPREMIIREIRQLTQEAIDVTISVEGGEELARRTFNERVGVVGGISIIGTSGIVVPFSNEAFVESIARELQVVRAMGCDEVGLVSGKRGETALLSEQPSLRIVHYGNFVGDALCKAHQLGFSRVVLGVMIGKAVKLAEGHLDTHSHKVLMNREFLVQVATEVGIRDGAERISRITMARELYGCMPPIFFSRISELCMRHCRTMFPEGKLEFHLICDNPV